MQSRINGILVYMCGLLVLLAAASAAAQEVRIKDKQDANLSLQLNEQGIKAVGAEKFDEAQSLFEKSIRADPGNITAAFNLAGVLLNNKKIDQAVDLLKRYLKVSPEDVGLNTRLADCYFSRKQIDEARLFYEKAYAVDPAYPRLATKLGTIYGMKNQMHKAEEMYLLAVRQNPDDVRSLENLGVILIANGKANQALPYIKQALKIDGSAHLYQLLGQAYQTSGDSENAAIAFKKAREAGLPASKQTEQ